MWSQYSCVNHRGITLSLITKIKRPIRRALCRVKKRLPIGVTQFDKMCDNFFATYDIPDNDSMRRALATMIMHLPPDRCRASQHYFATALYKAMSNEIAYNFIQSLKEKDKPVDAKATSVP